jgi:dUTP pyrophosphatase
VGAGSAFKTRFLSQAYSNSLAAYHEFLQIKIRRLTPEAHLPEYAHGPEEDAGMDLRATAGVILEPGIPQAIATGLAIELPAGYEAQLRPRSGLALKHAITLPNAPATIDPGYRGEIKVILLNMGRQSYEIHAGDRIAQMVIARYESIQWLETDLSDSARGAGGFGSSGR